MYNAYKYTYIHVRVYMDNYVRVYMDRYGSTVCVDLTGLCCCLVAVVRVLYEASRCTQHQASHCDAVRGT